MSVARKLVAVFYADVAGYSRLTGADEVGTHQRVMAMLDDITSQIGNAGGTVLRYAGDAVLATFPSVILAVDTAAEIQNALADGNADIANDERVSIRIGINLGDVIEDRGEVYGDGVNLAARLEAAAEPGGICLSGAAHDQVEGKASIAFTDGGEKNFKNIVRAVHVWRWSPNGPMAPTPSHVLRKSDANRSIAVLPFTNMSGDSEQEYFSDGISEDLITALSRCRDLRVFARNSTFMFKNESVDICAIGVSLGARYVVEGSVRKAGNRVRVTAQLIDVQDGAHVWAERFDRDLTDIFEVQDEIVAGVATQLGFRLTDLISSDWRDGSSESVTSYDHLMRARAAWRRGDAARTVEHYTSSIEADPKNAAALAGLAFFYAEDWTMQSLGLSIEQLAAKSREFAEAAVALNDGDPMVSHYVGTAYVVLGDLDRARYHLERAVSLNPHFSYAPINLGLTIACMGDHEEGMRLIQQALHLESRIAPAVQVIPMIVHYLMRDYAAAAATFERTENPFPWQYLLHAVFLAQLGQLDDACDARKEFNKRVPAEFSVDDMVSMLCGMMRLPEDKEHWLEGFRKAGAII